MIRLFVNCYHAWLSHVYWTDYLATQSDNLELRCALRRASENHAKRVH